jgi:hypothetical protein
LGHKASFGLAGLLVGMLVQPPVGSKRAARPFIARRHRGAVYTDDAHADRISGTAPELAELLHEITDDPVNLHHGLGQDLDLDADLNSGNRTMCNLKSRIVDGRSHGDQLAEGAVASTGVDTSPAVFGV